MDQEGHLIDSSSPEKERSHAYNNKGGILGVIWRPFYWFRMLSDELHWSFVLSVMIVYGINQGLNLGLTIISTQYYMKDELKVQPSEAQIFLGVIQIPWIIKPLWGLLTDIVPIVGYRRRPYLILAGLIGVASMLVLSTRANLQLAFAVLSLMACSMGAALANVTIDACVTENTIHHPSLAGDMQSLCGISSSTGQLIGYIVSGFLVHLMGPKGVFGVLSIPAGLVIVVGMMLRERVNRNLDYRRVNQKFVDAGKSMWMALRTPNVWRPCLYMYLSLAVSMHIHEGMFYWYTDAKSGPSFSQEIVGSISSVGAIGSLCGVLLYQNVFRNYPFRHVLFWTQLLFGASGMIDLILVLRVNLLFGIPDYIVAVIDASVTHMIGRLKWMPLLVLSSKLCPPGIEGTFFALLMSIDHVGILTGSWAGGFLLHSLNVTRTEFGNLWIVVLVRSLARLLPITILFLVPNIDHNASVLPAEVLQSKKRVDSNGLKSDDMEMASLVKNFESELGE